MGHIVVAAPGIDRFHLIERLGRELGARGHRLTVLCLDASDFEFWAAQELRVVRIAPGATDAHRLPLDEFAEIDCRRSGRRAAGRALAAARRRLQPFVSGLRRWFEADPPDLVLFHQRRTGAHALIQFVARECGTRPVWTGSGLLPHTIQIDDEGLDGDARTARRSAWDFRGLDSDRDFLRSALAAAVGRSVPPALARRAIQVPPLWRRLCAAWQDRCLGQWPFAAVGAWRQGLGTTPPTPGRADLPTRPFLAVLLQRDDDDRLLLDCDAAPRPAQLVAAARAAARRLDPTMPVVAVLPPGGLLVSEFAPLRRLDGVQIEHADAALDACIAATAVVTINDGLGAAAVLADTPTVHLGRCLYGVPGIATRGSLATMADDVARAIADDQPELRSRFLSWMLTHGHIWCSAEQPDHNGLCGFVLQIERRVARPQTAAARLQYRAGPAWPLAKEGT